MIGTAAGAVAEVAAIQWLARREAYSRGDMQMSADSCAALSEADGYSWSAYTDPVQRALEELVEPGRLLFNPPDQMRLGQTERVEVRLTRSLELDAELLEKLQGPGKPKLEDIKTASRMAVTLKGDGFHIDCRSDEEQAVTKDDITTWEFDIRAKKAGQQQLFMSVSLRVKVPGQPLVHKSIPVRQATINVRITVPALAGVVFGDWKWATATAIAIASAILLVFFH